ncbi:sulfurtransferase [Clostridiaceae bacterium 35-E11]
MKRSSKLLLFTLVASLMLLAVGCSSIETDTAEQGLYIIEANQVGELLKGDGVVLVDTQNPEDYAKEHIKDAVNISRSDVVMNIPVPNMLAPKGKIEEVLGKKGISNDTIIVIYDQNNNMDSARLWWTLMVYGHEKIKVVSGGLNALKATGLETSTEVPTVKEAKYTAKDKNTEMIATLDDVKMQVNEPKENIVLLDTRSQEEFNEGTIPGSILSDYSENNYSDGTYKSPQHIQIQYIEKGITPDKTIIMYCKTSIRGAQTYLALYDAGYRNLKLYDGAWVQYSANKTLPVQTPTGNKVEPSQQDMS